MVFAEGPFENRLSSDSNVIIYHETFYWTVKKELYVK